jgi:threonylcarbamoyladenosine tRNA methylthiotransferase MtaB
MFENSLQIVKEADITYLHVFPFSPREGTPAARMPQVLRGVGKARAARLRALGDEQYNKLLASRVGQIESVLVERDGMGRTQQFVPIAVPGHVSGSMLTVTTTGVSADGLVGEPLRTAA